jgi:hypothetical protein
MGVVSKIGTAVKVGQGVAAVLTVKVDINPKHGDVDRVSLLGFLPLFTRDVDGTARILGFRARRLDR